MSSYYSAFEKVVGHEGGFTANPKDRGNWTSGKIGIGELKGTKYGISAMSYPHLDIRNLTLAQAQAIYKTDFWDRVRGDELDPAVAFNVFDGAVNSGVTRSIKWLQEAVGATADGIFGPRTLAEVRRRTPAKIIARYNSRRLLFLTQLNDTTWREFGRGLVARVAQNLQV